MLEETINRVRQGVLDIRTANTIGFLAGIQLKALGQEKECEQPKDRGESVSIYRSIFNRPGFTHPDEKPDEKVYELYPPEEQAGTMPELAAPLGECIYNLQTPSDHQDEIITIEVDDPKGY